MTPEGTFVETEPEARAQPDSRGVLILGPDYLAIDDPDGAVRLIDFKLRREMRFSADAHDFGNDSLFSQVDFRDFEAVNRAFMTQLNAKMRLPMSPDNEQYLFESGLGARTRVLPAIEISLSRTGDQVTASYKARPIAWFVFGPASLDPRQGEMLGRALRYFSFVHPAALDAVIPFGRAPGEVSGLRPGFFETIDRVTMSFEVVGEETRAYPLPGGLAARVHGGPAGGVGMVGANRDFANQVIDIGLKAVAGMAGTARPIPDDYAADAAQAFRGGDLLGAGLALSALAAHYPDEASVCGARDAPARCAAEAEQTRAVMRDSRFRAITEAARHCARGEQEAGVRAIAAVDVSGEKHGYVASFILSCLLQGLDPAKARSILGSRYPAASNENARRAIEANPFIPAYYYDLGERFIGAWDMTTGWRLWEIGRGLGGGVKGDPYDLHVEPRERELASRYRGMF